MNIIITGKGMDLTPPIREYIEKKIGGLDKFYDRVIKAEVRVGKQSQHHLKGEVFIAECKLDVPGVDPFASVNEKSLYKAIDKLRDYLESELKKHKVKQREKTKKAKRVVRQYKAYQD